MQANMGANEGSANMGSMANDGVLTYPPHPPACLFSPRPSPVEIYLGILSWRIRQEACRAHREAPPPLSQQPRVPLLSSAFPTGDLLEHPE